MGGRYAGRTCSTPLVATHFPCWLIPSMRTLTSHKKHYATTWVCNIEYPVSTRARLHGERLQLNGKEVYVRPLAWEC